MTIDTKVCRGCRLLVEDFGRDQSKPDGRQSRCKRCRSLAAADRYAADPTVGRSLSLAERGAYAARTPAQVAQDRARLRPDGLKRCRTCHDRKPLEAFVKSTHRTDGLHGARRCCVAAHRLAK